jgi:hypothetical protein
MAYKNHPPLVSFCWKCNRHIRQICSARIDWTRATVWGMHCQTNRALLSIQQSIQEYNTVFVQKAISNFSNPKLETIWIFDRENDKESCCEMHWQLDNVRNAEMNDYFVCRQRVQTFVRNYYLNLIIFLQIYI